MDVPGLQLQAAQLTQLRPAGASVRAAGEAGGDPQLRDRLVRALVGAGAAGDSGGVELPARVELRMNLDREIDRVIARVVDSDTGEVVREVPPEELVELARTMKALMGALLDRRA
jgi:flagellar protein FlaG